MINIFMFGLAGSGKDTAAKIMNRLFRVEPLALADGVREEYTRFTGKTDYRQNRNMLIQIGETYKIVYGRDVWCRQLLKRISEGKQIGKYSTTTSFVITDGRYNHEYDFFVLQRGYIPVKITANHKTRIQRMQERGDDIDFNALAYEEAHFISDHYGTYEIDNNGTLDELAEQIQDLFDELIQLRTIHWG